MKSFPPKEKATIANYAVLHGTSAAIRHFKSKHPDLKWTTVNDWKKAIVLKTNFRGVVNTAILIAAATGILQVRDPAALECNGATSS